MRVLVVGAGAVGGFFGARLVRAGADVTFLVRPARAAQLHADGLVVIGPNGDRSTTPVTIVGADTLSGNWDLVLLATKATAVPAAMDDFGPAVGPGTAILPVLNGIDHLDALSGRFGAERVLGGVAVVATELADDGAITLLGPAASLTFGELDGVASERVRDFHTVCSAADFVSAVSETIEQDMWEKWFFMATGGAATVLLGGPVGQLVAAPDGPSLVRAIVAEVAAVQRATGHEPRAAARDRVASVLTQAGSTFATSLYRDFVGGRRTEVEPILGALVRRAAERGISAPLLTAAAVRLRVHESGLS